MITLTDIFAGAGGSSTGAASVPGIEIRTAANHWQLAVDVHQQNHPETDHTCVDLHLEDPRRFPRTDVLWASPECTKWSQARGKADALTAELGGDPSLFDGVPDDLSTTDIDEATRSRLLMFDVLRFVEHHRYRAVVVENVVDIATQAKYAAAWQRWQAGLRRLGYAYRVVSHNAMHAQAHGMPAPQSRDRLYIVAWPEREKAPDVDRVMRPKAWCDRCDQVVESRQAWKPGRTVGKYRAQYVYTCSQCGSVVEPGWMPASSAIDWTIRGSRIGDRPKPLAEKTRARIAAGIARYWGRPVDREMRTMTTRNETALAFMISQRDGAERRVRQLDQPIWTLTASGNNVGVVRPFIAELRGGGSTARSTEDPAATFTASGNHHGLVCPSGGTWNEDARPTDEALRALTTRESYALVAPYYGGSATARPASDPIGTISTRDHHALIMRHNTPRSNPAQMVTPASQVMRTLTTTGHQSVITPGDIEAAKAQVDDCEFRMLEPSEIAAGMAFPASYLWSGSRRDRVKLAGNAVCPPAARDLVAAVVESLA